MHKEPNPSPMDARSRRLILLIAVVALFFATACPSDLARLREILRRPRPQIAPIDTSQGAPSQADQALALALSQEEPYYVWRVTRRFIPQDGVPTADQCQEGADLLQTGRAFFALRSPIPPPPLTATEAYTLPLMIGGTEGAFAILEDYTDWSPTPLLSVPLEYRPEHHAFLNSELPSAPGERWLAFGLADSPFLDCSSVATLEQWRFALDLWLDFGGAPDACAGCVLPFYYCYVGQEPPPFFNQLRGALKAVGLNSYQGQGITCLGPHPLRLRETTEPLALLGAHNAWITPTQTISLRHSLWNWSGSPVMVTLAHSSTLGLPWGIYEGSHAAPDQPLRPITGPIRLERHPFPGRMRYFWVVADVPAGAPSGPETLTLTATDVTSPTHSATTWNLLWVGDWVAPDLPWPQPRKSIYLPLALRQ